MLRLSELKLPLDHPEDALQKAVLKRLRVPPDDVFEQRLVKRSIDARRRDQIQLIYSVDVRVRGEAALLRRLGKTSRVRQAPDTTYKPVTHVPRMVSLGVSTDPWWWGLVPVAISLRCCWHKWGFDRCYWSAGSL